jgi:hypothetical protein
MKIIKYITVTLVLILSVTQCKLPDNVDPKAATEVPVETLFTNGLVSLINQVDNNSVNLNTTRLYVQYWQQTTYFDESRYLMIDRQIPDNYIVEFYRDALMDLNNAKQIVTAEGYGGSNPATKAAVLDILMAYGFQACVDRFGNLPYSQALDPVNNTTPVYDDAAEIYNDLINIVETAVSTLKSNGGDSWGSADVMYNGDVASWKKFGATLLMRMGMRLADVNPAASKAAFTAAANAGVYTSMDDPGYLYYIGVTPNVNDIYDSYINDGRKDYLPTATIIDLMQDLEDPRIGKYFTKIDTAGNGNDADMVYLGAIAGFDGAQSYQLFSQFQDVFFDPTFPAMIIDYIEAEFLQAEAAARGGYSVSGTAEDHYNNAIMASILFWGGTQEEADAYLTSEKVKWDQAKWKELIGTQKWLAFYNRGIEAWTEWCRLDYPKLHTPEGMTYGDIPLRFVYPYNEKLQNEANYDQASAAIGGDATSTPVFWDVVPSPFK